MTTSGSIDVYGRTDTGLVRESNEDQFLIAELSKSMLIRQTSLAMGDSTRLAGKRPGYLLLVADGMGGRPAGDRASEIAVDSVVRTVLGTMPWFFRLEDHEEDLEDELKKVLERCQRNIEADALENPSRQGMGTTLTMAYVVWPRLYVVHVGDARAYLFRDSGVYQITQDHTVAQPLSPSAAAPGLARRVLWNVLGGGTPELWPEVYRLTLKDKDAILLATDGLTRHVSDSAIEGIMKDSPSAKEAVGELIAAANAGGGRDNTTVVVARFGSPDASTDTTVRMAAAALPDQTTSTVPDSRSAPVAETPSKGRKKALPEAPQAKGGDAESTT